MNSIISDNVMAASARDRCRSGVALVLPGGGARAAYQVGVLRAISQMMPREAPLPFRVLCGTSAGAIIASVLASHANQFRFGTWNLERVWRNFHIDQVFCADTASMLRAGTHWLLALVSGGFLVPPPRSLFDNSPLRQLLELHVNFSKIRQHLEHGALDAIAINATSYESSLAVCFYESARDQVPWKNVWQVGRSAELCLDHLMASAAVPFIFPPILLHDGFYGDGAMRQASPLQAAFNLGAERLLVIGVRSSSGSGSTKQSEDVTAQSQRSANAPSFGHIFGFMLDTLFADGVQQDIERVKQAARMTEAAYSHFATDPARRTILTIYPTEDFSLIAQRHTAELPLALKVLFRTMGAANPSGRMLLSYLLFEARYTRELILLGYKDAMARRTEIHDFIVSDR